MLLVGSYPAKIDEKYRLKIPVRLRRDMPDTEDNTYFVTSMNGLSAQIYPIPVWERVVQKLQEPPRMDPAKLKLQKVTNYYGMLAQMDPQGRILIPQALREDAQISGDVLVIGRNDHVEVWNSEAIRKDIKDQPLTDADMQRLSDLGF